MKSLLFNILFEICYQLPMFLIKRHVFIFFFQEPFPEIWTLYKGKESLLAVEKVYYPEEIWPVSQKPGPEWTEYLMYTEKNMFTDLTKKTLIDIFMPGRK